VVPVASIDHAANAAVVKPDRIATADLIEYVGKRATDRGRRQHPAAPIATGRSSGAQVSRENQRVARRQPQEGLPRCELVNDCVERLAVIRVCRQPQRCPRNDIGRSLQLGPCPGAGDVHDPETPLGVTGIAERNAIAGGQPIEPRPRNREHGIRLRRWPLWSGTIGQPDARGHGDATERIACDWAAATISSRIAARVSM
jgi:hypothetical protein